MGAHCNRTLEDMTPPAHQKPIVSDMTFHTLAKYIGSGTTLVSVVLSLLLIWMHAMNYTKAREQRQIIRILFMVPVYSIASLAQIFWYTHAVYIEVISTCYEAFALAAFFALVCHYVAPDVHSQKVFFREMSPIKPWIFPLNLFARCCGGQRGIWRTPRSGLTWFNICWVSIYQYIVTRIASTVIAVVTEAFELYCESSNSPVFAHIWVSALNMVAVTIAMFCVVQVYVQLKDPLVEQKLFTKILAIKLVVFLVLWQTVLISVATSSTVHMIKPTATISYPDIKVGIPNLLVCCEMALFAIFHFWAFSFRPYRTSASKTFYPVPDATRGSPYLENEHHPKSGGFLGILALVDAMNPWDLVKAFARGMRWLFCGVKRRKEDISYENSMPMTSRPGSPDGGRKSTSSDAPLKPVGSGNSDDAVLKANNFNRESQSSVAPPKERYEPMRYESSPALAHQMDSEPYDAGRFVSNSEGTLPYPSDAYDTRMPYRPYVPDEPSPYDSRTTETQQSGVIDTQRIDYRRS